MSSKQLKVILNYVRDKGLVASNCTLMAMVLWDQLRMGTIELCQLMRKLEIYGKLKYADGQYSIMEEKE